MDDSGFWKLADTLLHVYARVGGGACQTGRYACNFVLYCSYVHVSTYFQAAACGGESGLPA